MRFTTSKILVLVLLLAAGGSIAWAQSNEDRNTFGTHGDKEDMPKNVKELLFKIQIDQSKKDYQELLDRADELVAITDQFEKSAESNGANAELSPEKLAAAEKLIKKIRGELGGGDDDGEVDSETLKPSGRTDAIKYLRQEAVELMDELKKTSRFTISVVAIQSSNAVLRLVRFLRTEN